MDNANLLVVAMAERCLALIQNADQPESGLPKVLHLNHLSWMCDNILKHAEEWPATKLNRWIGFIQCAMMANRILDFGEAKAMFDKAKIAHGEFSEDLVDHLDPESAFNLEIGGQG
ncbi:MAG: hypothetical protein ACKVT0_13070 [Planctomycetaceae bacterium]